MKFSQFALVAALSLSGSVVHAVEIPGTVNWSRPVALAHLELRSVSGEFSEIRKASLTMTKQDGTKTTGFALLIDDQSYALGIAEKSVGECGSVEYTAQVQRKAEDPSSTLSLRVIDHETRYCKDLRPARWEAEVVSGFGKMEAIGNPKPVFTIQ